MLSCFAGCCTALALSLEYAWHRRGRPPKPGIHTSRYQPTITFTLSAFPRLSRCCSGGLGPFFASPLCSHPAPFSFSIHMCLVLPSLPCHHSAATPTESPLPTASIPTTAGCRAAHSPFVINFEPILPIERLAVRRTRSSVACLCLNTHHPCCTLYRRYYRSVTPSLHARTRWRIRLNNYQLLMM